MLNVILLITPVFHLTPNPLLENAILKVYTVPISLWGESPCDFQELRAAKQQAPSVLKTWILGNVHQIKIEGQRLLTSFSLFFFKLIWPTYLTINRLLPLENYQNFPSVMLQQSVFVLLQICPQRGSAFLQNGSNVHCLFKIMTLHFWLPHPGPQSFQRQGIENTSGGGAWVAQSVKIPTLGLGSGLWSQGQEIEPGVGLHTQCKVCLRPSLSPSPSRLPGSLSNK